MMLLVLSTALCLSLPQVLRNQIPEQKPWMNPRSDPETRASALLAFMTLDEKLAMLHGYDSDYVGYVPENVRLGIPALAMNDGPQGFRDNARPGSSTSFPCALSVAASWDESVAESWGSAMGDEFFRKGANVQLGPGVCIARVPVNGRNFEYISGEDPVLGATLVGPVIRGIQNNGVIANAKHFVNNNQETNRLFQNSVVDSRTEHEIYFQPFKAAVEAGVGSFMCSYNKVNGKWACENGDTLTAYLREEAGFKGWVMSDWGATHSVSIDLGLDQEMPAKDFFGDKLADLVKSGALSESFVDDSTKRILTAMFQVGLFDRPNAYKISNNVTNEVNKAVAESVTAASIVLLKNAPILHTTISNKTSNYNDNDTHQNGLRTLLPFNPSPLLESSGKAKGAADSIHRSRNSSNSVNSSRVTGTVVYRLAVFGEYALQPTVRGGGSGEVVPARVTGPLWSIRERFANIPAVSNCSGGTFEQDVDYFQPGNPSVLASSVEECCELCSKRGDCGYFTFQKASNLCWLKASNRGRRSSSGVVSGTCWKDLSAACSGDYCVSYETDPAKSASLAERSDAAIVFVGVTSSEGADRTNLSLTDDQNVLVQTVAAAQPNTVLVAISPGALLLPASDALGAILLAFMPGQEFGPAIASILFGDVNPSGHLPITIPNVENEMKFSEAQYPGLDNAQQTIYSEKLQVGYRWYHQNNVAPLYAFGHGLSYTTFEFSNLTLTKLPHPENSTRVLANFCIENTGAVGGRCVPQLYVSFPEECEEPPRQLKKFSKVALEPGEVVCPKFELSEDAFSIYTDGWTQIPGDYVVEVGQASNDVAFLKATVSLP